MENNTDTDAIVIGGGPGGCIAALSLRKLGRSVTLLEKSRFPRYQIGESLLPGTLSILSRLEVLEPVLAVGFPIKKAATFLWGDHYKPWSFSLATPKTAPWVFDYALQVDRAEYDDILLKAAVNAGVNVLYDHQVIKSDWKNEDSEVTVFWRSDNTEGTISSYYLIDASGQHSSIAKQIGQRNFDPYFKNFSLWSYFQGGKRFTGEIEGNVISEAFSGGWIWLIPLKNGRYSVGVITNIDSKQELRDLGKLAFFQQCLAKAPEISAILADAQQIEDIRTCSDWSYQSSVFSAGNVFLCGDAACFIDPLFSQGIHMACHAGVLAASAIDYLLNSPKEKKPVQQWYEHHYRDTYSIYHRFVSAFYAAYKGQDNGFWSINDRASLHPNHAQNDHTIRYSKHQISKLQKGAELLIELGEHITDDLEEGYDADKFALRRLTWATEYERRLQDIKHIQWCSGQPQLIPSYTIEPKSFRLQTCSRLTNGQGLVCNVAPLNEACKQLFSGLNDNPLSYRKLLRTLRKSGLTIPAAQLIRYLFETGFIEGYNQQGEQVELYPLLRFIGVGGENELP